MRLPEDVEKAVFELATQATRENRKRVSENTVMVELLRRGLESTKDSFIWRHERELAAVLLRFAEGCALIDCRNLRLGVTKRDGSVLENSIGLDMMMPTGHVSEMLEALFRALSVDMVASMMTKPGEVEE